MKTMKKTPSFIGIVVSLYLLIDHANDWLITTILRVVELGDEKTINTIMVFNLMFLITHIVLIIFGDTIYFNVKDTSIRKQTLIIYTVFCLGASFIVSNSIYSSDKVESTTSVVIENESTSKITPEQEAKEIEDRWSNCK